MRSVAVMIILGLVLCMSSAVFAEDPSVLKEVSASVTGGHTRVAFQFNGDVRFSTEQAKNGIRILFSRTRAAAPQVLNRQSPNAGPVESIGFQRPAGDNIVAVLAFVTGSTYRVICPSGGNALFVDVNGSAAVRQTAAPKPAPARTSPAIAQPPAAEPVYVPSGSSLVDIPAVARRQMELEAPAEALTGRTSANSDHLTMSGLIALSVAISLVATGLVLIVLIRMVRRDPVAVPVVVPAAVAATVAPAIPPRAHRHAERAPEPDDDMKPEPDRIRALFNAPQREEEPEEEPGRETSLQLARTFRRGSEEITLARKFHEHPSPALTPAKMQTAMARATTKGQRLTAARKLGVGRGEFDLAEKLKSLSQPPAQEGKEQQ